MTEPADSGATAAADRGRAEVEAVLQGRSRRTAAVSLIREAALLPVLVVLIVIGAFVNSAFLTVSNISGIGEQIAALGVTVVGESLILLIGGMDLSLEGTYGLAPMVAAWLMVPVAEDGSGGRARPHPAVLVALPGGGRLAVGAAIGVMNGLLIVKGRLNGFIVTLGMTIVLAGLQLGIVHGNTLFNLPSAFVYLGSASIGAVPVSFVVAVIIFVGVGVFLRYHRTGRAIYAVGGNLAAARAAGIKVDRIRIGVYVAGSILAAIGGLMEAGRVSAVTGQQGYQEGIIFSVFAAAVIGGVSLRGGRGNMVGAASGVILLGLVQNILDLANAPNYWIEAVTGGVILVALILARLIGGEAAAGGAAAQGAAGPAAAAGLARAGSARHDHDCWLRPLRRAFPHFADAERVRRDEPEPRLLGRGSGRADRCRGWAGRAFACLHHRAGQRHPARGGPSARAVPGRPRPRRDPVRPWRAVPAARRRQPAALAGT